MRNRRKKKRMFLPVLFCLLLLSGGMTAYGAEAGQAEVSLPVEQKFQTENELDGLNGRFRYRLRAEEGAPLPQGAREDVYEFTMDGNQKGQIGPITYTYAGVYNYTMNQIIGREEEHYTYDRRTYQIQVYVKSEAGGGMSAQVIIKNETGAKTEEALFENSFRRTAAGGKTETSGKNPDRPSTSDPSKPDRIKTGDEAAIGMWILAIILSALALIVSLERANARKHKD